MGQKNKQRKQAVSDRLSQLKPEGEAARRGGAEIGRARDASGREVAVWRFDAGALANSRARRAWKALVDQARALSHPSLIAVLDGGTDDGEGRPWLMCEPVVGETLTSALQRGPLGGEALEVGRDLLEGLAQLHARGVVHGALSPEQVLLVRQDGRLRARLLPGGFTRLVGPETETPWGPVRVDAEWAAPEVAKGEPVDASADVYSAALLFHAMFAGQHPVPASPGRDRLTSRLMGEAGDLPKHAVSDPAREVSVREALRRALKKDPARRCAGAQELLRALEPGAAPPPEPAPLLPAGAVCAACPQKIPPASARSWDRHASDRPFRCAACGEVFCGKTHWDPRTLTCKRCVERAAAANPSQSDIQPVQDAPAAAPPAPRAAAPTAATPAAPPAPVAPPVAAPPPPAANGGPARGASPDAPAAERQRALRELAAVSRDVAPGPARPPSDPPARPATPPAPAPRLSAADAVQEAWETEKMRRETARARAEAARSEPQPRPAPAPVPAPTAPRPAPALVAEGGALPLVAAGLGFVVLTLGALWLGDRRAARERLSAVETERQRAVGELEELAAESALAVGGLEGRLRQAEAAREAAAREAQAAASARDTAAQQAREATAARDAAVREQAQLQLARERAQEELATARREVASWRAENERLQRAAAAEGEEARQKKARLAEVEGLLGGARQAQQGAEARLARLQAQIQAAQDASEAARRHLESLQQQLAAREARVAELERKLAELAARPAPAAEPRPPVAPGTEQSQALALAPLGGGAGGEGEGVALGGAGAWPARAVLRLPLAAARPLLEQARAGEAVLAVRVRTAPGAAPGLRLHGGAAAAGAAPDPLRPGRYAAPGPQGEGEARFWVGSEVAAAWLAGAPAEGGELVLLLEPAAGEVALTRALEARLVASPVGGDAALRLRELERR